MNWTKELLSEIHINEVKWVIAFAISSFTQQFQFYLFYHAIHSIQSTNQFIPINSPQLIEEWLMIELRVNERNGKEWKLNLIMEWSAANARTESNN